MFDRTNALIEKTLKDLARASFWVTIAVSCILLGLNAYKIAVNVDRTVYFVLYIILGAVSLINLIFFAATNKYKKSRTVIVSRRIGRFTKYFVNACIIALVLIEFVNVGASNLGIILSAISIICFLAQILFEIIRVIYANYLELFKIAVTKDMEPYAALLDPKTTFYKKTGNFFSSIADKIHGVKKEEPELSGKEKVVEDLADVLRERKAEERKSRQASELNKTKRQFRRIFKRNSSKEE